MPAARATFVHLATSSATIFPNACGPACEGSSTPAATMRSRDSGASTTRAMSTLSLFTIAAGMQPTLTLNPLEPAATMTAYIVQVSLGDVPHGSVAYQTIFATGLMLLLLTLLFNIAGHVLKKRYRQVY